MRPLSVEDNLILLRNGNFSGHSSSWKMHSNLCFLILRVQLYVNLKFQVPGHLFAHCHYQNSVFHFANKTVESKVRINKYMLNLSSHQNQVSKFILNNANSGQT